MVQVAVRKEFGLTSSIDHLPLSFVREAEAAANANIIDIYKGVVREMYDNTQKALADAGIIRVRLLRGVEDLTFGVPRQEGAFAHSIREFETSPASSFSSSLASASSFANADGR